MYLPDYENKMRFPGEYILGVIVMSLLVMALVMTFAGALDKEFAFQDAVYSRGRNE